ncbi:hypothetical protein RJ639_002454 [Escallonia herrerae]|uniref:Uncharacterized protein n=1 Tax=Escallonia herrerae TaxID=1293975 RepID=A0AA88X9Q2_9ASTE|nr:hypothetical protein RJ639_002454 [Escallonia herrerae]
MKSEWIILLRLLALQWLIVLCVSQDFDFYYFVQQISDMATKLHKDWPSLACPSSDGLRFLEHEWLKHGTCSESILNQHSYFQAALDLKRKSNLLQVLKNAGITPSDSKSYSVVNIKEAVTEGLGYAPYIECNVDASGNHQLYQIYLCVDTSASSFIECPVLPHGRRCGSEIKFPSFSGMHEEL